MPQNAKTELDALIETVVAHLHGLKGVRNVQLASSAGATRNAMLAWERANYPAKLPTALEAFLERSDGLSLTWSMEHMGEELPLGSMHINDLKHLSRVEIQPEEIRVDSGPNRPTHASQLTLPDAGSAPALMAFDLDSTAHDGRLCLLYRHESPDAPQVWFQDLSRGWYFVAAGFSDYFRLVLVHLGLPRWQYAYTEVGLDPAAKHWIRLLAPQRLQAHVEGEGAGRGGAPAKARPREPVSASPRHAATPLATEGGCGANRLAATPGGRSTRPPVLPSSSSSSTRQSLCRQRPPSGATSQAPYGDGRPASAGSVVRQ